MKLFKKLRKGFTLIELVVVIAVIAILSAVSVVSYVAITNKAHQSNDQQKVDQVNLSLAALEVSSKPSTMYEAVKAVEEDGFKPANFKAEAKNYRFAYAMEENKFVIVEKESKVVYPKDLTALQCPSANLWLFEDAASDFEGGFSRYLRGEGLSGEVSADAGIDVGDNSGISKVTYESSATQDVVIRTNGGTLNVNGVNTHVDHYGLLKLGNILAVSGSTYVEHGTVSKLDIKEEAQAVVIEKGSMVYEIQNASDNLVIKDAYVAEVKGTDAASGEANPEGKIKVSTFDQLQSLALADQVGISLDGKTIQLQNNIDMSGKSWVPFGYSGSLPFSGIIDGNGKTIKNLSKFNLSGVSEFKAQAGDVGTPVGLIAYAKGNVTISKLTVECNISVSDGLGVAGFIGIYDNIGEVSSYSTCSVTISECTVKGTISAKSKVGGFIGSAYITPPEARKNNKINDVTYSFVKCTNDAAISDQKASGNIRAGGFIGTFAFKQLKGISPATFATHISFSECYNNKTVKSVSDNGGYVIGNLQSGDSSSLPAMVLDLSGVTNAISGLEPIGQNNAQPSKVTIG